MTFFKNLCVGLVLVFGFFLHTNSSASDRSISSDNGRVVLEALKLEQAGETEKALSIYDTLLEQGTLNPYELGVIHTMKGQVYFKLKDYDAAIAAF